MVTVTNAYPRSGYTSLDHLITGNELDDMLGERFQNVSAAKERARKLFDGECHRGLEGNPVSLTVRLDTGDEHQVTA